jgi:hypothetical protein
VIRVVYEGVLVSLGRLAEHDHVVVPLACRRVGRIRARLRKKTNDFPPTW